MKTIAQQLNVTKLPFEIKDHNGNEIYRENSIGDWHKYEYDTNGNIIYFEDSTGYWEKYEYDKKLNEVLFLNSSGTKRETT